ncbi:indolethylamine N-methyltransferase-like [Glandiceps talaboti]
MMMATTKGVPAKGDLKPFDVFPTSGDYLDRFYSTLEGAPEEAGLNEFMFKHLNRVFYKEGLSGKRLIDIGTGPCICNLAPACTNFDEIILSDYASDNRESLRQWIDNEHGAFDWKPFIKYMCELEGHSKVEEREKRLRTTIKDVLYCDVHQTNPVAPQTLPPFDCVTSAYCLESTCRTKEQWIQALRNVGCLLKNGGTLVHLALPLRYYIVDGKKYDGFTADKDFFKSAMVDAGFTNIDIQFMNNSVNTSTEIDYDFSFFAKATKK